MMDPEKAQLLWAVNEASSTRRWSRLRLVLFAACFIGLAGRFVRLPAESNKVSWRPCDRFECAHVSVPYSYHDKSETRSMSIALARHRASKDRRIGTLYLNPGGPGGSGVLLLEQSADKLSKMLDGRWDLIGFDPRGVK